VPVRAAERSLAVLPFENLSPDPENAFLADGLAEEVITDLARVRALRVIARGSALHYRGSTKTPREVGRELGAAYLLTGSVRRHGAALRVSVQLVEVERDAQVWAERFSGTIEDVFEIQERIAREIVTALELRLSPEESRRLAARAFRHAAAYELYLRARQSDFVFERETIAEGLRLLDQADAIEGERAPLLAARALLVWNEFNMRMRGEDAYAEARALADRALALDPGLAPALVARAMLEYGAERMDAALMLRLLQRAVEEERTPAALTWLTVTLGQLGRPDLGLRYASLAQQLDPLSAFAQSAAAFSLLFSGAVDEAAAVGVRMLQDAPDHHVVRFLVGSFLASGGRAAEAALVLGPCAPEGVYGTLAELLRRALAGDVAGVDALVADDALRAAAARDDQYCWSLAQALALVGRHDAAMEWLRRAAERSFVNARFFGEVDATLAPLRGRPDFQALLGDMRRRAAEIATEAGF
jgi:TolB-like protein